jgi:pheromone shutdown protein TraB
MAANQMGSEVGGELIAAVKEGGKLGSNIILGDRDYRVTIARVFDKLNFIELVKFIGLTIWDLMSFPFIKLKDYVKKTESDEVSASFYKVMRLLVEIRCIWVGLYRE